MIHYKTEEEIGQLGRVLDWYPKTLGELSNHIEPGAVFRTRQNSRNLHSR